MVLTGRKKPLGCSGSPLKDRLNEDFRACTLSSSRGLDLLRELVSDLCLLWRLKSSRANLQFLLQASASTFLVCIDVSAFPEHYAHSRAKSVPFMRMVARLFLGILGSLDDSADLHLAGEDDDQGYAFTAGAGVWGVPHTGRARCCDFTGALANQSGATSYKNTFSLQPYRYSEMDKCVMQF